MSRKFLRQQWPLIEQPLIKLLPISLLLINFLLFDQTLCRAIGWRYGACEFSPAVNSGS
jgi:hypothetical protein